MHVTEARPRRVGGASACGVRAPAGSAGDPGHSRLRRVEIRVARGGSKGVHELRGQRQSPGERNATGMGPPDGQAGASPGARTWANRAEFACSRIWTPERIQASQRTPSTRSARTCSRWGGHRQRGTASRARCLPRARGSWGARCVPSIDTRALPHVVAVRRRGLVAYPDHGADVSIPEPITATMPSWRCGISQTQRRGHRAPHYSRIRHAAHRPEPNG